jgi:hypothetical protein
MNRTMVAGLALVLTTSGAAVLTGGAPASADPAAVLAAANCVRNTVTTGYRGRGTIIYKAATTCQDLNVTNIQDNGADGYDTFAGFYRTADGVWHIGSRGYIGLHNGNVNVVLLSDVRTGAPMSVGSGGDGGDIVKVLH